NDGSLGREPRPLSPRSQRPRHRERLIALVEELPGRARRAARRHGISADESHGGGGGGGGGGAAAAGTPPPPSGGRAARAAAAAHRCRRHASSHRRRTCRWVTS